MGFAGRQFSGYISNPLTMFEAHSILWHYLWLAPNVLLLFLGILLLARGARQHFPAFIAFAILSSLAQFSVYLADVLPSLSALTFWLADWVKVGLEGILKFVLIAEIFGQVFGPYPSIVKLGKISIRAVGVLLTLAAALAAAYAPKDGNFGIISGVHLLEQTVYLIECGLLASLFMFSAYFHLRWRRPSFGIALGLSISASFQLAGWGVVANAGLSNTTRYYIDFVTMAAFHACVLLWYYYLLVPSKSSSHVLINSRMPKLPEQPVKTIPSIVPGDHAEVLSRWNRELERLIHQ